MSYTFQIKNYYTVRKEGEYPWPCQLDKKRTIYLYTDDVFTKQPDGTFFKHTGLGCFNIKLKPHQIKKVKDTAKLIMI